MDELAHRVRPPAGEPDGALVLLHGRGTSEDDLFPLLDLVDPERRLAGVTPRGPLALPPGGAHWYVVHRVGYPDRATFDPTLAKAAGAAVEYREAPIAHQIDPDWLPDLAGWLRSALDPVLRAG